jgi:hypothetical protein
MQLAPSYKEQITETCASKMYLTAFFANHQEQNVGSTSYENLEQNVMTRAWADNKTVTICT